MARAATLKQRVVWALTAAIALFVGVQAIVAYWVLDRQEDRIVDQIVLTEAQRLVHRLEAGEVAPDGDAMQLGPSLHAWVGANGDVPRVLAGLAPGQYQFKPGARPGTWPWPIRPGGGCTCATTPPTTSGGSTSSAPSCWDSGWPAR